MAHFISGMLSSSHFIPCHHFFGALNKFLLYPLEIEGQAREYAPVWQKTGGRYGRRISESIPEFAVAVVLKPQMRVKQIQHL